ncbi:MAG: hypothetical protein AAF661_01765 [Pseudomonadota bacterium]
MWARPTNGDLDPSFGRTPGLAAALLAPKGKAAFFLEGAARKVSVHTNKASPGFEERSEKRRVPKSAGWEVRYDRMEVPL